MPSPVPPQFDAFSGAEGSSNPFPFRTAFSLRILIAYWERTSDDGASPWAPMAQVIRARLQAAPALRAREIDRATLEAHADLVDLLMSAVFPRAQWDRQIAAAMPLYKAEVYYATPTCTRLDLFSPEAMYRHMQLDLDGYENGRTMMAYYFILEQCYGVDISFEFPMIITQENPATGLGRYFKLNIDKRYAWVEGDPPPLRDEDRARLLAQPTRRELWEEILPPEHFVLHGFGVVAALDVTDQQVVSAIKNDLLQRDGLTSVAGIDRLETHLRTLVNSPALRLGLLCLEDGTLDERTGKQTTRRVQPVGRSLLLSAGSAPHCPNRGNSVYAEALDAVAPVVVSDLSARETQTGYEAHLVSEGVASLIVAPLRSGDRLVGMLELASPNVGALNAFNALKVMEVMGLFATALRRSLDEREDRIQAVIKAQCTAVHPVVEWRFREAALRYLEAPPADSAERRMEPIVFHGVYPLYGLSDIRNSSTHRTDAIAADLQEQLSLAFAVIVEASAHRPLPSLDEIGFRIQRYSAELQHGLSAEHEVGVVEFLQRDVEGLFTHLERYGDRVRERVEAYRAALDPALGMLYRARRDYEASVAEVNEAVSCHLDRQQVYAQELAPHYFEKYKTDGVEHNIYVGDALVDDDASFDPLALRNLRLWQLMTMCGTSWALDKIAERLPMKLEAAHLVLVQDAPLAIRFRYDEKHFDVDGAYNTRYEIVKKRVDKASVRGTGERLTQPGHLAIVFSQDRAAQEYRTYLDYLRAAGYFGAPVEEFALEPLPGANGLRALRVPIADQPPGLHLDVTPEQTREAALHVV